MLQSSDQGAVLLVRWDDFRVLLPIGAEEGALDSPDVTRFSQDLTAVLLANSGDIDRNLLDWLQIAHTQLVLLSVDTNNRSGHPDPELLTALAGYLLYRTDHYGSIELVTDGHQLWIYIERECSAN